jgi:hypothetical protein
MTKFIIIKNTKRSGFRIDEQNGVKKTIAKTENIKLNEHSKKLKSID